MYRFLEMDDSSVKRHRNFDTERRWIWHDITTVTDEAVRQLEALTLSRRISHRFLSGWQAGGFNDTRRTLFEVLVSQGYSPGIYCSKTSRLTQSPGGDSTILNTLAELGYWWEYQVLNSKDFEYKTESVFIGHLGENPEEKYFPRSKSRG